MAEGRYSRFLPQQSSAKTIQVRDHAKGKGYGRVELVADLLYWLYWEFSLENKGEHGEWVLAQHIDKQQGTCELCIKGTWGLQLLLDGSCDDEMQGCCLCRLDGEFS